MAINALGKLFGSGLQMGPKPKNLRNKGYGLQMGPKPYMMPFRPPPFYGTWENPVGMGVKKKELEENDKEKVY